MTLRRAILFLVAAACALLAAGVAYLAFGDLSRHKPYIESLVSERLGRRFAIDGAFELEILPRVSVRAERVRLGNAPWGAAPNMVEIGRLAAQVRLTSLVFGPLDIPSLELRDATIALEKRADGRSNWALGAERARADENAGGADVDEMPAVLLNARLENVRVAYRAAGQTERTARLETFAIATQPDGRLALDGKGRLEGLGFELKGGLRRLDPLRGADLALAIEHPDAAALLKDLDAPAFAAGPLRIEAALKDADGRTRLEARGTLGGIEAKLEGGLRALDLVGSDLRFEASVPDAARVAAAFGVPGLPKGTLEAQGRVAVASEEARLEGVVAQLAGAKATAEGTIRRGGEADLRIDLSAESLAKLRPGLPAMPFSAGGRYAGSREQAELRDVKGRLGASDFSGRASASLTGKRRVEAELVSPSIDLTPFFARAGGDAPQREKAAKKKYVFDDSPLPLDALQDLDARVHAVLGELKLDRGALQEVDARLEAAGGKAVLEFRARGSVGGRLDGKLALARRGERGADLDLELRAAELRTGVGAGEGTKRGEAPDLRLNAALRASGASARQMASSADGRVLAALGPGKVASGIVDLVGSDLLAELAGKLNPFAAQDPYTQLDCAVVRADIAGGRAKLEPVLMQSEKVTVVASGRVDLRTEALTLEFNTRPRKGVGISAGMFATPFLQVGGTLASPSLGVGAKGAAAGAAAAMTGGATLLAQGLLDRVRGAQDLCAETLDKAGK